MPKKRTVRTSRAIHAHNAAAQLVYAYERGEMTDVDWQDVSDAYDSARKALTRNQLRLIRRNARRG